MNGRYPRPPALWSGRTVALLCLAVPLLVSKPTLARDWYIDGGYGNANNPGTQQQPFRYFWQANQSAKPGDNIYLLPTTTYPTLWVTASGTKAQPITISGTRAAPNLTHVSGTGNAFGVWIGASNVIVKNLDITAPGPWSAVHMPEGGHNITVTANNVHDAGGNGISSVGNDYVTISYNTVYGNAKNTTQNAFGSGISIKAAHDIDTYYGIKMRITGNIVYANTNTPNCKTAACYATASDSDGSGIIIDNNRRTESDNIWYRGYTLISNNVVFGNGGRGIHMYLADHISVNGNSTYKNNQDLYEGNFRPGEITGDYVSDITVYNNILSSDGGVGINNGAHTGTHVPVSFMYCSGFGKITVANNLGYRPQNDSDSFLVTRKNAIPVVTANNYWGNPYYENATLDPKTADFRVKPYSVALKHALVAFSVSQDMLGVKRTAPTTIGAYELAGP